MSRPDSPGVKIPPPLIYAAAVALGWLFDRRWPLPIGGGAARPIAAAILAIGWAVLAGVSIGRFRRVRASIVTIRPAAALVTGGPYRVTRNPMYVSLAALTLAFALMLDTWWAVVWLVPALVLVDRYVIAREERYLRRRFGAEYEAYTRRVRRWL